MRIGVVGCGAIGADIIRSVAAGEFAGLELVGINDSSGEKMTSLAEALGRPELAMALADVIEASDLVVEATAKSVMPMIAEQVLSHGRHLLSMSVGGLAERPDLSELAEKNRVNLYLPSGALAGIDAILAAREGGVHTVELTTTKNPRSLVGAPYLVRNNISLDGLTSPVCIFEGNAREAIEGFPSNANVAITLSFAGIGMEKTRVRFIADPDRSCTRQEVRVSGAVGTITTVTEGIVAPDNPKTGYLAILSSKALLRSFGSSLKIGV